MKATREAVLAAIYRERAFQDAKRGGLDQHPHQVGAWLTLMRKELQEAQDEWASQPNDREALKEILQVAALSVACLTQHAPNPTGDIPKDIVGMIDDVGELNDSRWEVGSWIGALQQRLRVAEHFCYAQLSDLESLGVVVIVLTGAICCLELHGIVEREQ